MNPKTKHIIIQMALWVMIVGLLLAIKVSHAATFFGCDTPSYDYEHYFTPLYSVRMPYSCGVMGSGLVISQDGFVWDTLTQSTYLNNVSNSYVWIDTWNADDDLSIVPEPSSAVAVILGPLWAFYKRRKHV